MRNRLLMAAVLAAGVGLTARADDKPLDRKDLDKAVAKATYDAAVVGTEIYNKGNHEGCFRLYQGTLKAVAPLLDHRPKLAASVKEKLDKAELQRPLDGAFTLREAIDEIQADINGVAKKPAADDKAAKKPLWDRLGGEKAVSAVVHDFVAAAAADPKVNFTRDGKYPIDAKGVEKLERLLVEQVSEATGGPLKYSGRAMKPLHAGMGITDDEFGALAGHLVATLKKYNVPQKEIDELVGVIATTKKDIVEEKK